MPKKCILVDYQACDPHHCENGICIAALACEKKVLTQEAPYEFPEVKASMCLGCSACLQACPKGALYML